MNLQEHFDAAMELAQSPIAEELGEAFDMLVDAHPNVDILQLLAITFYAGMLFQQSDDEDDPVLASISNEDALALIRSLLNKGEATLVIST